MGLQGSKLYYSIGEVAEMFNVNTSLIRFWEKEFAIIKPTKNKKGNRLFTQKDIQNFERIFQLVKIEGYTLDGAKQHLRQKSNKKKLNKVELLRALEEVKKELIQLQNKL
ncbi:MerR family transcriptional regulator [Crocinitomix algicola]|uniref:MerR family transcriptional regulator n=1 Tax=Crocinitomix algicola TaxID=1740263 RepID=UPI000A87F1D5|nr:MerR family transcriptional regulator [Crocinitomix algicola]